MFARGAVGDQQEQRIEELLALLRRSKRLRLRVEVAEATGASVLMTQDFRKEAKSILLQIRPMDDADAQVRLRCFFKMIVNHTLNCVMAEIDIVKENRKSITMDEFRRIISAMKLDPYVYKERR